MKRLVIFLSFFVLLVSADHKVEEFYLKNGLRVILIEKKTVVPIISLSIWYKCGSQCDAVSKSGVAHFLEHIAFDFSKREFCEYLDDIGADKNAFTSINVVCFHEIFNKIYLEKVLFNEAKRLQGLDIEDEVFHNEKKAVLEERSMSVDSNSDGMYSEILLANLFNRQIGGIEVIGWKHEIESIEKKDLKRFYEKWIAPNNATLILVGDFNSNQVKQWTEKYFENIPSVKSSREIPEENKNYFPREIEYRSTKNGVLASAEYVYRVPFKSKNNVRKSIALSIVVEILEQPLFFIKGIMKKISDVVCAVSISYEDYYQYDTFSIRFNTNSVDDLNSAEEMWPYFRKKLINKYINEEHLNKIKKQKLIALAYQKEDIEKISNYFGWPLSFGFSLEDIKSADKIIQSITVEECNNVLQEVLSQKPIAIMRSLPKGYDRD